MILIVKALPIVALAIALAGCATVNHDIDLSQVDQLTEGVSTKEDAVRLFGKPTSVTLLNGTTTYGWGYAHATAFGATTGKYLSLGFDSSGHLITKVANTTDLKH